MFWFGCTWIVTLPLICSTKVFYAVNVLSSPNLICYRDNEQFQPCGTLDILLNELYSQNISRIYLLDRALQISRDIHLNFSSHYSMKVKPWSNNSFSTLICNSDFSMTFHGTKEITIQSIQFKGCGKFHSLILIESNEWPVIFVQFINVTFSQSGQSSIQIVSDVHELQVINSIFTGGIKDVDINITGAILKAIFKSTTFSLNTIGSLIAHGSLNESSLDIHNCIFSNNIVTDFSIQIYTFYSIAIVSSSFEENFANNLIQVENASNISIIGSCFYSNVVQNGSVLHLRSGQSKASFIFFDNIVSNNTLKQSNKGVMSVNGLQTIIRNCVFQRNVNRNESTLTIFESSLTVINVTIFEGNQASLGGAVSGRSIQNLYLYRCNFTNNSANSGGALSISSGAIVIQNSYFNNNIAKEHGGALQVHAGMVNITGSNWFNNTSLKGDGGAINITSDNFLAVLSKFSFNSARSGGAISMNKGYEGYVFINNIFFEQNQARTGNGGALSMSNFHMATMATAPVELDGIVINDSIFNDNSAILGNGGALHIKDDKFTIGIYESTFYSNTAVWGGALSIVDNNVTVIYYSNFTLNLAVFGGGALNSSGIKVELHSCNFNWNRAYVYGGAVSIGSLVAFAAFETNFTANLANHGGAITVHDLHMVILLTCFFYNNTSEWKGGALFVAKKNTELNFIADCIFENNSSAESGGAIAFDAIDPFSTLHYFCRNIFDRVNNIIKELNRVVHHDFSNKLLLDKSDYFNNFTVIANCIFSHNTATNQRSKGGAISVYGRHSEDIPVIANYDYD